jgi:hypothetical protein
MKPSRQQGEENLSGELENDGVKHPSASNQDETIDAEAAATLLHCDSYQIETLARRGEIPGTKIGRGWIFLRSQLLHAIAVKAESESVQRRVAAQRTVAVSRGEDIPQLRNAPRRRGRPRKAMPLPLNLEVVRCQASTKALEQDPTREDSRTV